MTRALLVIDMQNDFCLQNGCLYVPGAEEIIPTINSIKPLFSICVFSKCWHTADHMSFAKNHNLSFPDENGEIPEIETSWGMQHLWPVHCVEGTEGAHIHQSLNVNVEDSDLILHKGTNPKCESYSAFMENDGNSRPTFKDGRTLERVLQDYEIEEVYVCGVATDFCVGETILDSIKCGFKTFLLEDASAGSDQEMTKEMKKRILQEGGQIIKSSQIDS